MDEGAAGTSAEASPPVVSDPPVVFVLAFALPVAAVLAWFLARLMGGRWLDQAEVQSAPEPWKPALEPPSDAVLRVDPPEDAGSGVDRGADPR